MPAVWAQILGPALRGGSWNNNHQNARLSARNNNHPNNQWNNNGFRVVGSHSFLCPASSAD
jgi:formylglycine-generating enzyme required for sulfatase activity